MTGERVAVTDGATISLSNEFPESFDRPASQRDASGRWRRAGRVSIATPQEGPMPATAMASLPYALMALAGGVLWWGDHYRAASIPPWAPYDFDWTYFLATALGVWW
jgi:hypothetical protein